METDETPEVTTVAQRRLANFEKTKARYRAAGIVFDDAEYLALVQRLIDGEMTMPDVAEQWDRTRQTHAANRRANTASNVHSPPEDQDGMLHELLRQAV